VIDARLFKYVAIAFGVCFLLKVGLDLQAMPLGPMEYAAAVVFGIALHLLVIVRLPVFHTFYVGRRCVVEQRPRGLADAQAASVLSMVIAGVVAGVAGAALDGQHATQLGLCAGVAAGAMSFYSAYR
jgi:hypothetical protein